MDFAPKLVCPIRVNLPPDLLKVRREKQGAHAACDGSHLNQQKDKVASGNDRHKGVFLPQAMTDSIKTPSSGGPEGPPLEETTEQSERTRKKIAVVIVHLLAR